MKNGLAIGRTGQHNFPANVIRLVVRQLILTQSAVIELKKIVSSQIVKILSDCISSELISDSLSILNLISV